MTSPHAARRARHAAAWLGAGLVVLTLATFAPGLEGGFVWDDHALLEGNALLQDPGRLGDALAGPFLQDGGGGSYWRPVMTLALWTQARLFGADPLGYHVVGLALHLACVLLAFGWLRRRLPPGEPAATWAAALGAGLFAVHPSRPQTVTWIAGSTDLWMTLLVLLALRAWDGPPSRRRVPLTAALLGLAVLAKEAAAVVPALLLAETWLLPGRAAAAPGAPAAPSARPRRAAWAVLGAVLAVVAVRLALHPPVRELAGADLTGSWLGRVLASAGHYAARIAWPIEPSLQLAARRLGADDLEAFALWSQLLGALAALAAVALALAAWRRPAWRPALADALWIAAPLAPVLHLLPLDLRWLVADRYLYLPLLGVSALLARGAANWLEAEGGLTPRDLRVALVAVAGGCALLPSAIASAWHAHVLTSDRSLWAYELSLRHDNAFAAEHLAKALLAEGAPGEALEVLAETCPRVAADPADRARVAAFAAGLLLARTPDADAAGLAALRRFYDDLVTTGSAHLAAPPVDCAVRLGEAARERVAAAVDHVRVPRAIAWARTGDLAGAEAQLAAAARDSGGFAGALANLALVQARQGRYDDALATLARRHGDPRLEATLRRVVEARATDGARPGDPVDAAVQAARAALALGSPGDARAALAPLLADHPTDPRVVLGLVRVELADRRPAEARALVEAARAADPEHAASWDDVLRRLEAPAPTPP